MLNFLLRRIHREEIFKTSASLSSETSKIQRVTIKWPECDEPVELVDTVGFCDNTSVKSLKEVASAVTATAVGYNLGLYLIPITGVRFDIQDAKSLQLMCKVLEGNIAGNKNTFIVFTQADRLDPSARDKAIQTWTTETFQKLRENDINIPNDQFYVCRNDRLEEFEAWVKTLVFKNPYLAPKMRADAEKLIK